MEQCPDCGKKLKDVEHVEASYGNEQSVYIGPEDHRLQDCIKHLAAEIQKLHRMLNITTEKQLP